MAKNNLDVILSKEGITSNQLASRTNLNASTVKSVFMKKRTVAPSTQELMVGAVNALSKKSYSVEEIFPAKLKPKAKQRARAVHFVGEPAAK